MNDDLKLGLKLLSDFQNHIGDRSTTFLSYNAFPKVLDWYYRVWHKEIGLLEKDEKPLDAWSQYYELLGQIERIFDAINSRMLTESTMDVYYFFEQLSKHVEAHKDDKLLVNGTDRYYAEQLLTRFYAIFFEKIDTSASKYYIWDSYLPDGWKIRAATLETNIIQRITLVQYFQWAQDRISGAKEKDFDRALSDVSENLFPAVYPIWWAAILLFTLSSYDPSNRVKSLIEKPWTFGGASRIMSFVGNREETEQTEAARDSQIRLAIESQKTNTIEMVKVLSKMVPVFYQTFNTETLKALIAQANSLEYQTESVFENRRKMLLEIFRAISLSITKSK